MKNKSILKRVKNIVSMHELNTPVIFHYVKVNKFNTAAQKVKSESLMLPSPLHQTDKYFKRFFYNKIF